MGVVYKARQNKLNRVVALKMIRSGELADDEQVRRFYLEAKAAANLDHPGIVPVYEVGEANGQHFYSMAFVAGMSLNDRVKRNGPLPPRIAAGLMKSVAEAVQFAHEKGIVHRDVKPQNILLDDQDQPRVTDFGLAKQLETPSELTMTGDIVGTPSYMPPEQAAGKIKEVGTTSDVYSLGATLYFLLTGRPPFQTASMAETIRQVIDDEPVPPRRLNPAIPRDLETICLKCLGKEPGKRYRSARDLADDLQRFLDDEPIVARPLGPVARFRRSMRRRPVLAGSATTLVGLLVLTGGIGCVALAVKSFGSIGFRFFGDHLTPAVTFSLPVEDEQETPLFHLGPGGLNVAELKLFVRSKSFEMQAPGDIDLLVDDDKALDDEHSTNRTTQQMLKKRSAETKLSVHYNFPVRYAVLDEAGETLEKGSTRAVWTSRWTEGGPGVSPAKDSAWLEPVVEIARFRAPRSGRVRLRVEVAPDDIYHAQVEAIEVRVFENVRDNQNLSLAGGALCCGSPIALLAGFLLLLYGPYLIATRAKPVGRR